MEDNVMCEKKEMTKNKPLYEAIASLSWPRVGESMLLRVSGRENGREWNDYTTSNVVAVERIADTLMLAETKNSYYLVVVNAKHLLWKGAKSAYWAETAAIPAMNKPAYLRVFDRHLPDSNCGNMMWDAAVTSPVVGINKMRIRERDYYLVETQNTLYVVRDYKDIMFALAKERRPEIGSPVELCVRTVDGKGREVWKTLTTDAVTKIVKIEGAAVMAVDTEDKRYIVMINQEKLLEKGEKPAYLAKAGEDVVITAGEGLKCSIFDCFPRAPMAWANAITSLVENGDFLPFAYGGNGVPPYFVETYYSVYVLLFEG